MTAAVRASGLGPRAIVLVALAWAAAGLYPVAAQTNKAGSKESKSRQDSSDQNGSDEPIPGNGGQRSQDWT